MIGMGRMVFGYGKCVDGLSVVSLLNFGGCCVREGLSAR